MYIHTIIYPQPDMEAQKGGRFEDQEFRGSGLGFRLLNKKPSAFNQGDSLGEDIECLDSKPSALQVH